MSNHKGIPMRRTFVSELFSCTLLLVLFSLTHEQTMDMDEIRRCAGVCNDDTFQDVNFDYCLNACRFVHRYISGEFDDADTETNYVDEEGVNNEAASDVTSAEDMEKRKSNFVRIGRQKSSFVRIGRSADGQRKIRASSFVRIGKADPEYTDNDLRDAVAKRASAFVRIGKSNGPRYLYKRPSSFVRIGKKSSLPSTDLSSSPLWSLQDDALDAEKRKSAFVRIGKSMTSADGAQDDVNKRASSFVRIGRPSSFVRIGKKSSSGRDANYKRTSSFVRIGKKSDDDVMTDDAGSYDSAAAAYDPYTLYEDLYNSNNMMAGQKRASNFVRIGKNYGNEQADDVIPEMGADAAKRASSFVRIGKSSPTYGDKRMSNFVRIGKRSPDAHDDDSSASDHVVDDSQSESSSQ